MPYLPKTGSNDVLSGKNLTLDNFSWQKLGPRVLSSQKVDSRKFCLTKTYTGAVFPGKNLALSSSFVENLISNEN